MSESLHFLATCCRLKRKGNLFVISALIWMLHHATVYMVKTHHCHNPAGRSFFTNAVAAHVIKIWLCEFISRRAKILVLVLMISYISKVLKKLKADWPHLCDYLHAPTDNRHTDKHLRQVLALFCPGLRVLMDRQTDRHYQVRYFHASLIGWLKKSFFSRKVNLPTWIGVPFGAQKKKMTMNFFFSNFKGSHRPPPQNLLFFRHIVKFKESLSY